MQKKEWGARKYNHMHRQKTDKLTVVIKLLRGMALFSFLIPDLVPRPSSPPTILRVHRKTQITITTVVIIS